MIRFGRMKSSIDVIRQCGRTVDKEPHDKGYLLSRAYYVQVRDPGSVHQAD